MIRLHRHRRSLPHGMAVAAAGFATTAIAFGPARMGFGLFLPAFRSDLALSTNGASMVASLGFFAFLLGLPAAAWLDAQHGPRAPVAAGILAAALGFALVAAATETVTLTIGVALAGSSAGLCWTPFNDAVERIVLPDARSGALAVVSTGTTLGVAAVGALAMAVSVALLDWRAAWAVFWGAAMLVALTALLALPTGRRPSPSRTSLGTFLDPDALPLYATALVFGATNAAWVSFAADRVVNAGGLPGLPERGAGAVLFLAYGICGLIGLATRPIEARIGLNALLSLIFAAFAVSLALTGLYPGYWAGAAAAAGLHGAAVMTISAVLSFWSLRLFPGRGSFGFTAALIAAATGSVLGPAIAGALLTRLGPQLAFMVMAAPAALVSLGCIGAGQARSFRVEDERYGQG
jgi:predicted MFS family arabinose efflux permease